MTTEDISKEGNNLSEHLIFSKYTPLTKYGRLALLHEKLGKWNYILKFVLYCDGIDYEEQVEIQKK